MHHTLTIAALVSLASSAAGGTRTVTTAEGDGADTYIAKYAPTLNFGGDSRLRVKNAAPTPPDFDRKAYLRFDIGPVVAGAVTGELVLTVAADPEGEPVTGEQVFRVYGLDDASTGNTADLRPDQGGWVEGTGYFGIQRTDGISWNDAPANDGTAAGLDGTATLLGTFTLEATGTAGEFVSFTSPELDGFLNADTNGLVTMVVTRETFDPNFAGFVHSFFSHEHGAGGPRLTLTDVPCNPADLVSTFGQLDLADINAFTAGFVAQDPIADLNADGLFDLSDVNLFVTSFVAGCP